jgi:exonuclease III
MISKKTSAMLLLALVCLELVLVSVYVPQAEASKRKMMKKLKKLKDILPILMALKAKKKKIILLPLPIP